MGGQRIAGACVASVLVLGPGLCLGGAAVGDSFTNSLGMRLVHIPAGRFQMGQERGGDWDERPVHPVILSRPFWMGATEVTNAQYEAFDPEHKACRGIRGLSKGDEEAVLFVSWHDAVRFCQWLSEKEGKPYRLPTEAEWEYACRAGTTTAFHTGDTLHKAYHRHQRFEWHPEPVSLAVGRTPPNAWGLHEMHGNAEEWCLDWYGPYEPGEQTDPVGRATGEVKVTRGGSHNTPVGFLRSANRLGTLPEDKHWLIGFRVVCGELPPTKPLPPPPAPRWAQDVAHDRHEWSGGPPPDEPFFQEPRRYVRIPPGSNGPLFARHNHCPSITWCPNGDLLACWFSTNRERGREMTIAASRLRRGAEAWDPAAEFFNAPDRNMTGSSLWHDGEGTLFHFNGLEADGGWANLALVLRTSTDNGATWHTRLIHPQHQPRNQVIDGTFRTREGFLVQPCDAVHGGSGGTAIHISRDGGKTWTDPGAGRPKPDFRRDPSGSTIAGIHAAVAQLRDGSLLAFGRGDNRLGSDENLGQRMPQSVSRDLGTTWHYSPSPWPPIGGNQRPVLLRLREGPLLFVSYTHDFFKYRKAPDRAPPFLVADAAGRKRRIVGMFAALSFDEGKTWPVRRPVTPGGPARKLTGVTLTGTVLFDETHAEPRGYLAATQTPDGVVHLISSGLHYAFNLAWLKTPIPAAPGEGPGKESP